MKKIIILLIGLIVCTTFSGVHAEDQVMLLNGVTSTGLGAAQKYDGNLNWHRCVAIWGGTTPTNIRFGIHFADDTDEFDTPRYDVDRTMTSSPYKFYIKNKGGDYVKGNYISKSGGDGTTSITLKCSGVKVE